MDGIIIGDLEFVRSAAAPDNRLESAKILKEIALDSGKLAFDTLDAEVFTKSLHAELGNVSENTSVLLCRGDKQYARFLSNTIERIGPNNYHLTANSPMSALATMAHPGGMYTGQTVEEVVRDICGPVPVMVKTNIAQMALYGWLPYVEPPHTSARDNLVRVLFVVGASLGTDRNGVLRVEGLWNGASGTLSSDTLYSGGRVTYDSKKITAVSVTEHQYVKGNEEKELYNGTTQDGDIVVFDEPMHGLIASGFVIKDSGANWAKLSAGNGILKGRAYIHTTRLVTEKVSESSTENVKTVTDATLVSLVNSDAVAKRLANYYRCSEIVKASVVDAGDIPGDVVSIYHPYDKKMVNACIVNANTNISSTLKTDLTALVGFTPMKIGQTEYYDYAVVIDRDGTFVVPENVDSIRIVLIGGGQGGSNGLKGEDGETNRGGEDGGKGGKGGEGGLGGSGGRIYQITLSVVQGQVFPVVIGIGGTGAGYSESSEHGLYGTETKFGDISSENGSSAGSGFQDLFSGKIYGKTGENGTTGALGGDGGRYDEDGHTGDGIDLSAGGRGGEKQVRSGGGTTTYYERAGTSSGSSDYTDIRAPSRAPIGYTSYSFTERSGYRTSGQYIRPEENTRPSAVYMDFNNGKELYQYNFTYYNDKNNIPCVRWTTTIFKAITRTRDTRYENWYGGGGGGGNTVGETGSSGGLVDGINDVIASGGKGADATAPSTPFLYGTGGTGGHGGGGGGGGGGFKRVQESDAESYSFESVAGIGGNGSAGSAGQNGCVIIYYGVPKIVQSGQLVDNEGREFFDKYGRRFIV